MNRFMECLCGPQVSVQRGCGASVDTHSAGDPLRRAQVPVRWSGALLCALPQRQPQHTVRTPSLPPRAALL